MSQINTFGGKGKGLVWLAENIDLGFQVPEFDTIDPSYHEDILRQEALAEIVGILQTRATGQHHIGKVTRLPKRLEDRCQELANQFNGENIMVRSSGLLSEDSDMFSGAGIYDSFEIRAEDLSPQSMLNAVLRVYTSVESERAKQYRRTNNLNDERMEVIVQKSAEGYNGVAMSRLQARAGIKPISWSDVRGAVVGSVNSEDAKVHTAYFSPRGRGFVKGSHRVIFQSEDAERAHVDFFEEQFVPLIDRIKKRYGKEFELEFVVNLPDKYNRWEENNPQPTIYAVQIRPLTNVQNKKVRFPKKEPIMEAEYCVGVGEYIGPWITTQRVRDGWAEPNHYAYLASRLEKMMPSYFGGMGGLFGLPEEGHKDYDVLTPNKMAIVITSPLGGPSAHALTIANERGIICLLGNRLQLEKSRRDSKSDDLDGFNRAMAQGLLGAALTSPVELAVPLSEVGPYIHVVSDGLRGRVYRATEQEARDFERKLVSGVTYKINPVANPREEDERWWDLELQITPSPAIISLDNIWNDFVEHMKQRTGKPLRFRGNDRFGVYSPSAEFEVYCAYFDPANRKAGIKIETGRSASEIANQQLTKQWFKEFTEKYQVGYIPVSR